MFQDLRYAARVLLRAPGFTLTAGLTLALGIGATTLMFSIVNAVLWRPLAFPDPHQLVMVFGANRQANIGQVRASAFDFADWRGRARSFEAMAGHVGTGFTFSGRGDPELVLGQLVTQDFFRMLGVQPVAGRTFGASEFSPGESARVVLSHRLWLRRFGGDAAIVGRDVTINGRPYTVVGVMPAGFEYPSDAYQLWAPLPSPPLPEMPPANRGSHYLQVAGRLKPGVRIAEARTELASIASALARQYPDSNRDLSATVIAFDEYFVRDLKAPLYVLLAAVGLVVLIACGNVTNLLLARATVRTREVAVRQALGAGRLRLVRQFLAESIVLYAVGAAGALALAGWGLSAVIALDPAHIPRLQQASIDQRVLLATLALSFVTAVVFGIAPAVQGTFTGPADALRAGGRSAGTTPARQRFRMSVVVCELALAVVLLVGAGLALRSLSKLTAVDPGFDADGQLTFGIVMPASRYTDQTRLIAFASQLTTQLASTAGVRVAGATTHLPMSGQNIENAFEVDGFVPPRPGEVAVAGMHGIVGDYFKAIGAQLVAGRFFTDADRAGSPRVAIVNEAFVRRYWPGQDAIGKRLLEGGNEGSQRTVVGIIRDIKHDGPAAEARPEVDLPYSQLEPSFMQTWARGLTFVLRTDAPLGAAVPAARATVASADRAMPLIDARPLSDVASESVSEPRFRTWLLSSFAGLAVTLAIVGVFGVLAYFVTQRTREIGIRVALGATQRDVIRMVMVRGMSLAAAGIALGVAASIPLARWMQALLFDVDPVDPLTLVSVSIGLTAIAALASYVPARRALRIEPVSALKLE